MLRCVFEWIPDPRDPRGVRHALTDILTVRACAVRSGRATLGDHRLGAGRRGSLRPGHRFAVQGHLAAGPARVGRRPARPSVGRPSSPAGR
ncbi:MAG: transposase family protein [Bifidobacteriaceae bacterium]|nr:transposase family protein [Bifidobacteriaceae bacterium]